jgi:hypothetical protein
MLQNFTKKLSAMLLGAALLATACSPENVQPVGRDARAAFDVFDPVAPEVFAPSCSDSVYARLQDSTGGYTVNYCKPFFGRPCPVIAPEWGTVTIINDWDSLIVRVNMAFGWFIDKAALSFGSSTPIQIDASTGRPLVTNDWLLLETDNDNSVSFYFDKSELAKDNNGCFEGALRLKVIRMNCPFCDVEDPLGKRELYLSTNNLAVRPSLSSIPSSNPINYITPHENIINWCWQTSCRPKVPGDRYQSRACPVSPTIPEYTCNATGAGIVSASTVRCLDVDGSLGSINFSGPGTLVVPAGRTVTCALNAFFGCTLIVEGTLNWTLTASYNSNMYIYVAPGGVLNRAGTSGSLITNGSGSVLVNGGTIDIDANLISKGAIYNNGTLTARNMTLSGGSALLSNKGEVIVEQNLTVNCGTPNTCSASMASTIQNCGRLDVNTSVNTAAGTAVKNYCSLVSRGSFTQAGTLTNQGLVVAGLSGGGNGYVNNGNTVFKAGSVLVSRFFNWGTNRTIEITSGDAWIIAANTTLNTNPTSNRLFFQNIGGTGKLAIPAGSTLTGSGELHIVDADLFGPNDVPLSDAALRQTLNPNPYMLLSTRSVVVQDDSIRYCYPY